MRISVLKNAVQCVHCSDLLFLQRYHPGGELRTKYFKQVSVSYLIAENKEKVKEELADIFAYGLLLADKYGFDLKEIVMEKIIRNGEKYPVEKAKGTAKKYNEL